MVRGVKVYQVSIASGAEDIEIPIGGAPHVAQVNIQFGDQTITRFTFNADWSQVIVRVNGADVTLTRMNGAMPDQYSLEPYGKWDDLPDKTLGGVFPDPDKVKTLMGGGYDQITYKYGTIVINGENTLPVIVSSK